MDKNSVLNGYVNSDEGPQSSRGFAEKYKTLFNSMDDGFALIEMIFDEKDKPVDWRYLETNKAFERQMGWKNADGKLVSDFLPEGIDRLLEIYGQVAVTGQSVRFEEELKPLHTWYEANAFKIGDEDSRRVAVLFKDITPRKQSEQLLRFQGNLLTSVHDTIIAVDQNTIITYWNKRAEEMFGWSAAEAIGRAPTELFGETPALVKLYSQLKSVDTFVEEIDYRRKDGRILHTEAHFRKLFDEREEYNGWVATIRDITERKEREKELRDIKDSLVLEVEALKTIHSVSSLQSDDLQALYQIILNEAIMLSKGDLGHLGLLNKEGNLEILAQEGMNDDLLAHLKNPWGVRTVQGEAIKAKHRVIVLDIAEGTVQDQFPLIRHYADQGVKTIQSTPMISKSGKVLGTLTTFYKTFHDFKDSELRVLDFLAKEAAAVIERIQAEEAVRQSEKRALALVDELRSQDENRNEFLNILSHELRNPLASMMMSLSLLNGKGQDEDSQRAIDIMTRQGNQLANLVDDLLDVARIRQNKIALKKERIHLNEIVYQSILDNNSRFADNQVKLISQLPGSPLYIEADVARLTQVLGNLLHNAAKFTSPGDRTRVSIWEDGDTKEAVIEVEDSGLGIAPDLLPDLFLPFMQVDRTLNRSKGGLGLGLAIVKGMVELHGGTVSVHSEGVGKGARFTMRLPLLAESQRVEVKQAPVSLLPSRYLKILVIDDIPDVADILSSLLRMQGHEVITAHSGREGISKAKDFLPDAILSDIGLPMMDGYEVARSIRQDSMLKNTFLVALSGYAQPNDIAKAKEAGFDRHVAKPVDIATLQRILDEMS